MRTGGTGSDFGSTDTIDCDRRSRWLDLMTDGTPEPAPPIEHLFWLVLALALVGLVGSLFLYAWPV